MKNAIDIANKESNEASNLLGRLSGLKLVKAEDTKGGGLVAAAKNIRTELKAAFPGVKFSVTTSRFSMGDSINVNWIDGPSVGQVDAIIDKYSAGSFDGMEDLYNYNNSPWTKAFGDAKYVSSSREYSSAMIEPAIAEVYDRYPSADGVIPTAEDYKMGRLYAFPENSSYSYQSLVYQNMNKKAGE